MHYFTKDELKGLLEHAYVVNPMYHKAMLVSVCHALRVSEMLALDGRDFQGGMVVCKRLKGNKT